MDIEEIKEAIDRLINDTSRPLEDCIDDARTLEYHCQIAAQSMEEDL